MTKPGKSGLVRIIDATYYSIMGYRTAWQTESAFRQECLLTLLLLPLAFILGETRLQEIMLITSCLFVLVVELLNSAIEAVVDYITNEEQPFAAAAKDMGSAAVTTSILIVGIIWVGIACENILDL